MPAASNRQVLPSGWITNAGIVPGIHDLDFASLRVEAQEDGGDVLAPRFFTVLPVVLIHARGQLIEGHVVEWPWREMRSESWWT